MECKKGLMESRVAIGMLAVQGFAVGLQILSRIILTQGTFIFALMTYRQIVGAICVAPLAFYHDRFVHILIPSPVLLNFVTIIKKFDLFGVDIYDAVNEMR